MQVRSRVAVSGGLVSPECICVKSLLICFLHVHQRAKNLNSNYPVDYTCLYQSIPYIRKFNI